MVMVRCLGRCTWVIGSQFELGSACDVRGSVGVVLRFMIFWGDS